MTPVRIGDIVECWNDTGPHKVRRFEGMAESAEYRWYLCGPIAPGFGIAGMSFRQCRVVPPARGEA